MRRLGAALGTLAVVLQFLTGAVHSPLPAAAPAFAFDATALCLAAGSIPHDGDTPARSPRSKSLACILCTASTAAAALPPESPRLWSAAAPAEYVAWHVADGCRRGIVVQAPPARGPPPLLPV